MNPIGVAQKDEEYLNVTSSVVEMYIENWLF